MLLKKRKPENVRKTNDTSETFLVKTSKKDADFPPTVIAAEKTPSKETFSPQDHKSVPEVTETAKDTASTQAKTNDDKIFLVGPQRTSSSTKNTCRFDYAPDICKDYNETGFCGFGDSCKFLHDRGDYKSGWELDNEWDARQQATKSLDYTIKETNEPALPITKCGICNNEFEPPIVETKCFHLFCEHCALSYYRSNKTCKICHAPVNGQFHIKKKTV